MYSTSAEEAYSRSKERIQGVLIAGQKLEGGKQAPEKIQTLRYSLVPEPQSAVLSAGQKFPDSDRFGRQPEPRRINCQAG